MQQFTTFRTATPAFPGNPAGQGTHAQDGWDDVDGGGMIKVN